ncbi:MAG: acyl-CoA dehydrogenase family protein [Nitrospinota bacterium]
MIESPFAAVRLRTLTPKEEAGGIQADIIARCVVGEEMATRRSGFAVWPDQVWKISAAIAKLGKEEQKKRFISSSGTTRRVYEGPFFALLQRRAKGTPGMGSKPQLD